jgi:uncharacterized membrane protein
MIFFPTIFIIFFLFVLLLPLLFLLGYFHIVSIGFSKLGISPEITFLLLFSILLGSAINIPLTKKRIVYERKRGFFGFWRHPVIKTQAIAINLGGAIIPILLSFYFLYLRWQAGFSLQPILIATLLMVILSKSLARIYPGRGITLPTLVPPVVAAFLALIFSSDFVAPTAFIVGTLGTLIGADLLNLRKVQKLSPGFISIGGGGVFDGIFLVGIVSALLS